MTRRWMLGSLGVGLCALLLGLDLTADNELANLFHTLSARLVVRLSASLTCGGTAGEEE